MFTKLHFLCQSIMQIRHVIATTFFSAQKCYFVLFVWVFFLHLCQHKTCLSPSCLCCVLNAVKQQALACYNSIWWGQKISCCSFEGINISEYRQKTRHRPCSLGGGGNFATFTSGTTGWVMGGGSAHFEPAQACVVIHSCNIKSAFKYISKCVW